MSKVPCARCGVMILPATAARNCGRCIPCSNGTRENIDASRVRAADDRERRASDPATLYWAALVDRVSGAGFDALPEVEKRYFAVGCLDGEVFNGGFHQFFSNSSGEYYAHAVAGLEDLGAAHSLELLRRAKQVLFGFGEVPTDRMARFATMRKNDDPSLHRRCDELDTLYYDDPDSLAERLSAYAR